MAHMFMMQKKQVPVAISLEKAHPELNSVDITPFKLRISQVIEANRNRGDFPGTDGPMDLQGFLRPECRRKGPVLPCHEQLPVLSLPGITMVYRFDMEFSPIG